MRSNEFICESSPDKEWDRQSTVYAPAEKDPWLKDPEMAKAREEKRRYIDKDGRIWNFDMSSMGVKNYQGLRKAKNIPGVNIKPVNIVGQRVYHCTNRIKAIEKSGGLKPKIDVTGMNEYGRNATHWDPFIPVKGIWVTTSDQAKWAGKNCLSFVIEPSDQVAKAYGEGLIVLNPIPWDRLTVEKT